MYSFQKTGNASIIRLKKSMIAISSAILNGGIRNNITAVINYTLGEEFVEYETMEDFCRNVANQHDCDPDATIVLLTSVPQRYGEWSKDGACFITAGLSNAKTLFPPPSEIRDERKYRPDTINSISLLDESLTENALIECYGMVKLAIFTEMIMWSKETRQDQTRVGTPTDCAVVLCHDGKSPLHFGGLCTKVGVSAAKSTRDSFRKAIRHKYESLRSVQR